METDPTICNGIAKGTISPVTKKIWDPPLTEDGVLTRSGKVVADEGSLVGLSGSAGTAAERTRDQTTSRPVVPSADTDFGKWNVRALRDMLNVS